jgi:hypothetical protein
MEYLVKDQIQRYSDQRESALLELISLNENLPFYDKKKQALEFQIDKCDFKILELVLTCERVKVIEINIKHQPK